MTRPVRNLVLILGDQLDHRFAAFDEFNRGNDIVWMAEVDEETTHVWCHKQRIALVLSAMRHFRDRLRKKYRTVGYHELQKQASKDRDGSFTEVLRQDVKQLRPDLLVDVEPGGFRVQTQLQSCADELGIELEIRADRDIYCSSEEFTQYADGRRSFLLEVFYRALRNNDDILMADTKQPEGGKWNFDHDNRERFAPSGPYEIPQPRMFRPDAVTKEVMELVQHRFAAHPGNLDHFTLPVTHRQAGVNVSATLDRKHAAKLRQLERRDMD